MLGLVLGSELGVLHVALRGALGVLALPDGLHEQRVRDLNLAGRHERRKVERRQRFKLLARLEDSQDSYFEIFFPVL